MSAFDKIYSYSEKQAYGRVDRITDKVYSLIKECYETCLEILERNRPVLDEIAAKLLEKKTLLYEDMEKICTVN